MDRMDAKRVINGTFGELWVDNDYMAETKGLEAKVSIDTSEVLQCGTLRKGYKATGVSGSGTITLNKVSSYFTKKISEKLKKGETLRATIISNLEDPESYGAERVKISDCVFTELTLANWAAGTLGEESIPFNFSDWDLLDTIDA